MSSDVNFAIGDNELMYHVVVAIPIGKVKRSPSIHVWLVNVNLCRHKRSDLFKVTIQSSIVCRMHSNHSVEERDNQSRITSITIITCF